MNAPSNRRPRPDVRALDLSDPLAAALSGFSPSVRPPALPASDVSYVVDDTAIGAAPWWRVPSCPRQRTRRAS